MSRFYFRGLIAWAAVVVALLWSGPANAQIIFDPSPTPQPGGLLNNIVTGVQYDIVNQAKAERRLQQVQARLARDAERGDSAAVDRDARRIESYRYRIVVDEWLIRKNSLQAPGCYPPPLRLDPQSCVAIADAARPAPSLFQTQLLQSPRPGPSTTAPTVPITIVNAEVSGAGVAFQIDGIDHQAAGGSRQELTVAPNARITYDSGGTLGQRRYQVAPGLYEFRSTAEGWALYKLPDRERR